MVEELAQRGARAGPPRLLPVDAVQRVREEEQDGHEEPDEAGDGTVVGLGVNSIALKMAQKWPQNGFLKKDMCLN